MMRLSGSQRRRVEKARHTPALLISFTTLGALVAAACIVTSTRKEPAEETAFRPTYESVPCPDDVLSALPAFRSCGYVTVLEDRAKPQGRKVRLFVAHVKTPSGHPSPDPMLSLGGDLGWQPDYPGIAPMADRVDRDVYMLDARGVGHSEPSLPCPEVATLRHSHPQISTSDPRVLPLFLGAVKTCHDRLARAGVDLSAFNLAEMAADVEDVRIALGIDRWNLHSLGTWSTVAFEVMRRFPDHVRTVTLDSPDVPQVDLFTEAIIGTRYAMANLADACTHAAACHRALPEPERALRKGLIDLRRSPARIDIGHRTLRVTDSAMIRLIRRWISLTELLPRLPAAIRSLREDTLDKDPVAAALMVDGPVLGLGYAGFGAPKNFSYGTFYSVLCQDEIAFVDWAAVRELAGDEPWFDDAYAHSPYVEVCKRWDSGEATTDPHRRVVSDIPTLILVGEFNAFAPLPLVRETAATLSRSWLVKIPNLGHNVLSSDCTVAIRNGWIDDPDSPPDTRCIADVDPVDLAS